MGIHLFRSFQTDSIHNLQKLNTKRQVYCPGIRTQTHESAPIAIENECTLDYFIQNWVFNTLLMICDAMWQNKVLLSWYFGIFINIWTFFGKTIYLVVTLGTTYLYTRLQPLGYQLF